MHLFYDHKIYNLMKKNPDENQEFVGMKIKLVYEIESECIFCIFNAFLNNKSYTVANFW